ncbi:hypothetical protein SRHO_G00270840 [Serrasalmus rhombeus]
MFLIGTLRPKKELILAYDASPYGVGAVLLHKMPEGMEKPIGFVSRTLSAAEKNYSQLDKEGLAVLFGVKKFHNYLFGRKFTIVTDHKPFISLFNEMRAVPQIASPRIQRWAVTLRAYEYSIVYKVGQENSNADAMSRLLLANEETKPSKEDQERVLMLDDSDAPLVTAGQIRKWTDRDTVLSRVHEYVLRGWSRKVNESAFSPCTSRQGELSIQDGCVLWGARVVIPQQGRAAVLQQVHQAHPGITRMKGLVRSYIWWPNLDSDIENIVKTCEVCQENRNLPPVAPLHPWEWPETPWRRIHIDYPGPWMDFRGQVRQKQLKQKEYHDHQARERSVNIGEEVYTQNFAPGPTWIPGTVEKRTGPVSYSITLGSGNTVRRHIDQVRCRHPTVLSSTLDVVDVLPDEVSPP